MTSWPAPIDGGCVCGALRYRLHKAPMYIHCCNCTSCQVETGGSFALNALIESEHVELLPGRDSKTVARPKIHVLPSNTGKGQAVVRCPRCLVVVWSHYWGMGPHVSFIRSGTVDKVAVDGRRQLHDALKPDMYIYQDFKQPWIVWPEGTEGQMQKKFYPIDKHWTGEQLERWKALEQKRVEWRKSDGDWGRVLRLDSESVEGAMGKLTLKSQL